MKNKKTNCWEYHNCGREPGGRNVPTLGVCPAASNDSYEGINSGKCAGRFCWAVAGTFCEGKIQGTYAEKRNSCRDCDFFKTVLAEEGTLNLRTKFLRFLPPYTKNSILNNLDIKTVNHSTRLITQGEKTDKVYVIKRGSCLLLVEKNGKIHPVDHRGEGDILNMPALFTGEPASSHIEAETDMELWVLEKSIFETIPKDDPDLFEFLTEIVADRFDSKRPMSDRTLGQYVATDIIGRGGYSIVYKGVDTINKQEVAIKMMRHNMVMDSDFLEKFRNEGKIIASLNHDNIIKVFNTMEQFRTAFIIMEYLNGVPISSILEKDKRIPSKDAIHYLIQTCKAVDYAYKQGILHKDINPENLMVIDNKQVKLVDFGLAVFIHEEDDLLDGALPYLAPEIFKGEISDIRSEIYSIGITAFEMVVGKRPFPETDPAVFTKMRDENEIPDPKDFVPDIPDSLQNFIIKACRLDPNKRYSSMEQAIYDLESIK